MAANVVCWFVPLAALLFGLSFSQNLLDYVLDSTIQELLSGVLQQFDESGQVANSDDDGATVGPRSLLAIPDSGRSCPDALDNGGRSLNVDTQLRKGPSVSPILGDDGRDEPALGRGRHPAGPGLGENNRSTRSSGRVIFQPRWHIKLGIAMMVSPLLYYTENPLMELLVLSIIFRTILSTIDYILTNFITFPHQPRVLEPEPGPINGRSKSSDSNTYRCVTEGYADTDIVSAQVGCGDHIPRWYPGSVLTYVICDETFPTPAHAAFASEQLEMAIRMWEGVGVSFKKRSRDRKASFRVVYKKTAENGNTAIFAQSFLPNEGPAKKRTLYIYELAFSDAHVNYQANILAHEVGHILGLRHEFAMETERGVLSATWKQRNPRSVMMYFDHPSKWRVQRKDLKDLRAFYEYSMNTYQGKPVTDFEPQRFDYPEN